MSDMILSDFYKVAKALSDREPANDPNGPLSATERFERQQAIKFARASTKLSGFKISPETEALSQRYINGEIELEEIFELLRSIHRR